MLLKWLSIVFGVGAVGALAFLNLGSAWADPDALWRIITTECVPHASAPDPQHCAAVDIRNGVERGTVVLKDRNGAVQYLLLPTARITGIESPALLAPQMPNYFAAAWRARTFVDALVHHAVPRDEMSLAVNSEQGRSQNQLHIHIDCLSVDVRDALRRHGEEIGDRWAPLAIPLAGVHYLARRVAGEELDPNPFSLLAELPDARVAMGKQTLVVVGANLPDGKPGFYLLSDHVDAVPGDMASGEMLQDHARACAAP
jgi:CDP-diacylglycerol pyrophosphatase